MKGGGSTTYPQEPLFRPEGPEFEPIPLEKRKIFQFRRGPRGIRPCPPPLMHVMFGWTPACFPILPLHEGPIFVVATTPVMR